MSDSSEENNIPEARMNAIARRRLTREAVLQSRAERLRSRKEQIAKIESLNAINNDAMLDNIATAVDRNGSCSSKKNDISQAIRYNFVHLLRGRKDQLRAMKEELKRLADRDRECGDGDSTAEEIALDVEITMSRLEKHEEDTAVIEKLLEKLLSTFEGNTRATFRRSNRHKSALHVNDTKREKNVAAVEKDLEEIVMVNRKFEELMAGMDELVTNHNKLVQSNKVLKAFLYQVAEHVGMKLKKEQLHDLVVQNEVQEMEDQMTHDETLLQVPGQKSGYFQGKGDGKKAPIKRMQENMCEEVQNSLREFKETTLKTMREKLIAEFKDEVRAEIKNEVRAEVIEEIREEVRTQVGKDVERKFDMMFANKMAAIFGSFSQSGGSN